MWFASNLEPLWARADKLPIIACAFYFIAHTHESIESVVVCARECRVALRSRVRGPRIRARARRARCMVSDKNAAAVVALPFRVTVVSSENPRSTKQIDKKKRTHSWSTHKALTHTRHAFK